MTEEEKQLLLKDLCMRLPYGVIIDSKKYNEAHYRKHYVQRLILVSVLRKVVTCIDVDDYPDPKCREHKLEYCKPYLRPMSSMTEEERKELYANFSIENIGEKYVDFGEFMCEGSPIIIKNIYGLLDFLNAHHFDYNGLIEKGLALPAPDGMYNGQNN